MEWREGDDGRQAEHADRIAQEGQRRRTDQVDHAAAGDERRAHQDARGRRRQQRASFDAPARRGVEPGYRRGWRGSSQVSDTRSWRDQLSCASSSILRKPARSYRRRAASSSLCVHSRTLR